MTRRRRSRRRKPFNDDGILPFHKACLENNFEEISRFLRNNQVDINRSVALSSRSGLAGQSPLHLALHNDGATVAIVDLLLENGAQVNAADPYGETPLHKAIKLGKKKTEILQKILEAGADVNAITDSCMIPGVTAMDFLLCHGNYSTEQLELLIKYGCRLNGYNTLDEGGYVAMAFICCRFQSEEKQILFNAMLDHPHTIDPDDEGRTVIHSLVAHHGTLLFCEDYVKLINQLVKVSGCDVDDQDVKGRTALCFAAQHANDCAFKALLICGADINITDNEGNLAFDYIRRRAENVTDKIAIHVKMLELLHLNVCQKNRDFAARVFKLLYLNYDSVRERVRKELELSKSIKIVLPSLTLHDFLKEISLPAASALIEHQTSIQKFFRDFKDERFVQLSSLFKFQYRKALARSQLAYRATVALSFISKCSELCAELIVRYLANDALKSLIKAQTID